MLKNEYKLVRKVSTEIVEVDVGFNGGDFSKLLVRVLNGEILPRERTLNEIYYKVSDTLKIIPATLFYSLMRIYTCITCSPYQSLILHILYVLPLLQPTLAQSEVYYVNLVSLLPYPN